MLSRRLCCFAVVMSQLSAFALAEERIDFNRDIRPILSDKCFHCHGPDAETREADLRLDDEENAKLDRDGYHVLLAGKPEESELVARITTDDPDLRMPPADVNKDVTAEEAALLKRWIQEGAVWSDHWAYVAPTKHPVPTVRDATWAINWIDHFIDAKLAKHKMVPSADADRVTLLRRLSFDLTGLPPSAEEVAQFATDNSPGAYEAAVDRLLSSDHFGERMAMYWLDLVRYADTVGYHGDQDHNISPYRDYIIDAFNQNMPFDQFTREQLAGDLIPNPTTDSKIASGYNRLLQTSHEGGVQKKEYLAIYAADRVRNVSNVWFGATVGCAQCHDHKYDPYTAKDFYSLSAFFADLDEAQHFKVGSNSLPTKRPPEIKVLTRLERERIAELDRLINDELQAAERIASAKSEKAAIEKAARMTMVSVAIAPRDVRVLPRGNWLDDSGELVTAAVPEFMGAASKTGDRSSRLDLANWLTDSRAGSGLLTARVMANRFWYLLFGNGISKDLDDFGGQGEPPTHPKLLDNLAIQFVESGWDMKATMKLIAMSRTYRQSSLVDPKLAEQDPYNRLYARQSRFRLPAEMVRDNVLAVSGLLVRDIGGASVKPYQPAGYYKHLNFPVRKYSAHMDDRQWRRGVYVHWQRQFVHPMMKAFDAPSREECTAQRPTSNTPTAAMTLLNDPTFVEAARVFAENVIRSAENDSQRLSNAYAAAVSRLPHDSERVLMFAQLGKWRTDYQADKDAAAKLVGVGTKPRDPAFDASELAAWTNICRVILNTSESVTRN